MLESYTYGVFGQPTVFDGAGTPQAAFQTAPSGNRFLYTGREWIAEAGVYDYRNRHYSPQLGRFLQTDPIRFSAGDVNLYRYVGNSVLYWRDPSGLIWPFLAPLLAGGGGAATAGTATAGTAAAGGLTAGGAATAVGGGFLAGLGLAELWDWLFNEADATDEEGEECEYDGQEEEDDAEEDYSEWEDIEEEHPLKNREKRNEERRDRPKDPQEKETRQRENEDLKRRSGMGGSDPSPTGEMW